MVPAIDDHDLFMWLEVTVFLLALLQVFLFIEYPEDCRRFRQLGKNLTEIIPRFPRKLLSAESLSYGGYSSWSNCSGF